MSSQFNRARPEGWGSATLGQVSECILGGTPSTEVPQYWAGDVRWMASGDVHLRRITDVPGRITSLGLRSSNAALTSSPAVAVALAGQGKTRGTVALTLCALCTNQSIALLKANVSDLRTDYLFYNLEWRYEELRARSSGGGRGGLSKAILEAVPIELPPLREQQRVAQILDTLDTAIHETEAIIAKLKAVKQGLLHDLLTRGIDANGELRPPQAEAPHLYKDSPLGWIPKEWDFDVISNLTTSSAIGPFGSDLVASDYRKAGVPVVFVRDVKPDCLSWKSNIYVSAGKAQALAAHKVVPGDVVATKMGLPPCVAAVYPDSMPNGVVTADIVRLRPDLNRILPGWMSAFINAPAVSKQVEQITAGVTRLKVTLRDVRNLHLAVPEPREQRLLLEHVDAIEARLRAEEQCLHKLLAQQSGLMDDLLTGRVRVTPLLAGAEREKEHA